MQHNPFRLIAGRSHPATRLAALALSGLLAGGLAVAGPAAAQTSAPASSAAAASGTASGTVKLGAPAKAPDVGPAAAYLTGQLVNGDHLYDNLMIDYGLSADLAIALASSGGQDQALAKVTGYLAAHVAEYADPKGTSQYPGPYSGAIGKLALLAEITGQNPKSFGGFDLLGLLGSEVCASADTAGACTAPGDFYQAFSTLSQSLAILALKRGGITPPASTVARLASLQCPGGGFTSELITGSQPCLPDVDTTGVAVQALLAANGPQPVLAAAKTFLLNAQQPDGGFVGTAGENANSTALAAQGLLAGVQDSVTAAAVSSARSFLAGLQNADGGFGVSAGKPASDVRATTQVIPAVTGSILLTLSHPITVGSPVSSTPAPSTSPVASHSPSSSPVAASSSAVVVPVAGSSADPALASTGSAPRMALWLSLLLIGFGLLALQIGRPVPVRVGRRH